jgi:hypothetical protein
MWRVRATDDPPQSVSQMKKALMKTLMTTWTMRLMV